MENPLILLTAIERRLKGKLVMGATATTEINRFDGDSGFKVYVRLGGTQVLNPNVYCGRLQHRIIMDIVDPKAANKRLDDLYKIYEVIIGDFGNWGSFIESIKGDDDKSTNYELASSYLETDGTFSLPTNTGAAMSVSFLVDETVMVE